MNHSMLTDKTKGDLTVTCTFCLEIPPSEPSSILDKILLSSYQKQLQLQMQCWIFHNPFLQFFSFESNIKPFAWCGLKQIFGDISGFYVYGTKQWIVDLQFFQLAIYSRSYNPMIPLGALKDWSLFYTWATDNSTFLSCKSVECRPFNSWNWTLVHILL